LSIFISHRRFIFFQLQEVGAQPLVTIISRLEARGHTYELDVFGGVMATRADNDEINSIYDLKDKIIGAGDINQIMGGQLQFYEMEKAGMSYVMDPCVKHLWSALPFN
jgi:hypothetical protein